MATKTVAVGLGPASEPAGAGRARGVRPPLAVVAPLRGRNYLLLWVAASVSFLGDQIQLVALPVFVLDMTHRPGTLGAVLTAQAVPRVALLLAGGVAIDRFQPKRVLIWSSLLAGVVVALMTAMAMTGETTLWRLYVLAALLGAASAVLMPAVNTIVADVVPAEQVRTANALRTFAFNGARFVGPPLAAALVAVGGAALAFGANALSFVLAAALVWPMRMAGRAPDAAAAAASPWRAFWEGLRAVKRDPVVWRIFLVCCGFSLGQGGAVAVGIPALAKLEMGAGDAGVGVLYGAFGVGALVATILVAALPALPSPGTCFCAAIATMGGALIAAAAAPTVAWAVPWLALAGVAFSLGPILGWTLVQTRTPAHLRGRAIALVTLGLAGAQPISLALCGALAEASGARAVLLAGGAVTALAGLYGVASRDVRTAE